MSGGHSMGFSRIVGPLTGDFLRASMAATLPPCAFVLNGEPMSTFTFNGKGYDAFSGLNDKVGRGISKGCITIDKASDFEAIRKVLLGARKWEIPALKGAMAYALVVVT